MIDINTQVCFPLRVYILFTAWAWISGLSIGILFMHRRQQIKSTRESLEESRRVLDGCKK